MAAINNTVLEDMYLQAQREYPNECCGILLGNRNTDSISENYPAGNTVGLEQRGIFYQIHPLELYQVEQEASARGLEVMGFYHSHPDHPAVLSRKDMESMVPDCVYVILSVIQGKVEDLRAYIKTGFGDEYAEIEMRR